MQFTTAELSILRQAAEIILRAQAGPAQPEPETGNFTVTRDWINANKTPGGAWKARQLAAIGVKWPPAGGWPDRVEGKQISQASRAHFESFAGKRVTSPDACEFGATGPVNAGAGCGCDTPPWESCAHHKAD